MKRHIHPAKKKGEAIAQMLMGRSPSVVAKELDISPRLAEKWKSEHKKKIMSNEITTESVEILSENEQEELVNTEAELSQTEIAELSRKLTQQFLLNTVAGLNAVSEVLMDKEFIKQDPMGAAKLLEITVQIAKTISKQED